MVASAQRNRPPASKAHGRNGSGGHAVVERFTPSNLEAIKRRRYSATTSWNRWWFPVWDADRRDYLILMAGTGQDMLRLNAWYGDRVRLVGVELNQAIFDLGLEARDARLAEFFAKPSVAMGIWRRPHVRRADHRNLRRDQFVLQRSDVRGGQWRPGDDAAVPASPEEAFAAYLRRLNPDGAIVDSVNNTSGTIPAPCGRSRPRYARCNPTRMSAGT